MLCYKVKREFVSGEIHTLQICKILHKRKQANLSCTELKCLSRNEQTQVKSLLIYLNIDRKLSTFILQHSLNLFRLVSCHLFKQSSGIVLQTSWGTFQSFLFGWWLVFVSFSVKMASHKDPQHHRSASLTVVTPWELLPQVGYFMYLL